VLNRSQHSNCNARHAASAIIQYEPPGIATPYAGVPDTPNLWRQLQPANVVLRPAPHCLAARPVSREDVAASIAAAISVAVPPNDRSGAVRRNAHFRHGAGQPPFGPPPDASDQFEVLSIEDMRNLPEPTWLIEGMLPARSSTLMFGASNSFKSFLALDMALSVATGHLWHGRAVTQGPVLIIATEGALGTCRQRIPGWLHCRGIDQNEGLGLIRQQVLMTERDDCDRLEQTIQARFQGNLALVLVDVWAGTIQGTEKDDEVVVARVSATQRLIARFGAAELAVTHVPWTDPKRARGHSHLWGSADTRLLVEGDRDLRTARITVDRHKDADSGAILSFALEPTEFTPAEGKTISTLVPALSTGGSTRTPKNLTPKEALAMRALADCITDNGRPCTPRPGMTEVKAVSIEIAREYLKNRSVTDRDKPDNERSQWARIREGLDLKGKIAIWADQLWLP